MGADKLYEDRKLIRLCNLQMAREILYRVCYGSSDISNNVAKSLLASKLVIKPAILQGFCRHKVKHADYPGIIPEEGHSVLGTYVTGLTDGDIYRLDAFEGSEYTRQKVKVYVSQRTGGKIESGDEMETAMTETYVYTCGDARLEKEEWDYEDFRKQKLMNWVDADHEYAGKRHSF